MTPDPISELEKLLLDAPDIPSLVAGSELCDALRSKQVTYTFSLTEAGVLTMLLTSIACQLATQLTDSSPPVLKNLLTLLDDITTKLDKPVIKLMTAGCPDEVKIYLSGFVPEHIPSFLECVRIHAERIARAKAMQTELRKNKTP